MAAGWLFCDVALWKEEKVVSANANEDALLDSFPCMTRFRKAADLTGRVSAAIQWGTRMATEKWPVGACVAEESQVVLKNIIERPQLLRQQPELKDLRAEPACQL